MLWGIIEALTEYLRRLGGTRRNFDMNHNKIDSNSNGGDDNGEESSPGKNCDMSYSAHCIYIYMHTHIIPPRRHNYTDQTFEGSCPF